MLSTPTRLNAVRREIDSEDSEGFDLLDLSALDGTPDDADLAPFLRFIELDS